MSQKWCLAATLFLFVCASLFVTSPLSSSRKFSTEARGAAMQTAKRQLNGLLPQSQFTFVTKVEEKETKKKEEPQKGRRALREEEVESQQKKQLREQCGARSRAQCMQAPYCYLDEKRQCKVMEELLISDDDNDRTLVCYDQQRGGDARPCWGSETLSGVAGFQCLTSWMFKPWFKWEVPTTKTDKLGDMRGRHVAENDDLYTLDNVCLSPWGALSGSRPHIEKYEGLDETDDVYHRNDFFRRYLGKVYPISVDNRVVVDRPIILFPISVDAMYNLGHTMHRVASLVELSRNVATWHGGQRPLVVVVLLTDSPLLDLSTNPLANFLGAFAHDGWVSVFAEAVSPTVGKDLLTRYLFPDGIADFESLRQTMGSNGVCFKKGYAWHNCLKSKCQNPQTGPIQFSILGIRSPQSIAIGQRLRSAVAKCVNVKIEAIRQLTASSGLSVVMSFRTKNRILLNWAALHNSFRQVLRVSNATLTTVFETHRAPVVALFQRLLRADLLMGVHGSGMALMMFLPPGACSAEVRSSWFADSTKSKDMARYIFGAQVTSANVFHTAVTIPRELQRIVDEDHNKYDVPLQLFQLLLGECTATERERKHEIVDRAKDVIQEYVNDANGEALTLMASPFFVDPWYTKSDLHNMCVLRSLKDARCRDVPHLVKEILCADSLHSRLPPISMWEELEAKYVVVGSYSSAVAAKACSVDGLVLQNGVATPPNLLIVHNFSALSFLQQLVRDELGCWRMGQTTVVFQNKT